MTTFLPANEKALPPNPNPQKRPNRPPSIPTATPASNSSPPPLLPAKVHGERHKARQRNRPDAACEGRHRGAAANPPRNPSCITIPPSAPPPPRRWKNRERRGRRCGRRRSIMRRRWNCPTWRKRNRCRRVRRVGVAAVAARGGRRRWNLWMWIRPWLRRRFHRRQRATVDPPFDSHCGISIPPTTRSANPLSKLRWINP
mmetsp:Transcript_9010/g.19455  ORF Transcript_9010/g.19455 Transcript_9010/m.19455 type:complete len:200 (+) Transcript_9010:1405-2004(+)